MPGKTQVTETAYESDHILDLIDKILKVAITNIFLKTKGNHDKRSKAKI